MAVLQLEVVYRILKDFLRVCEFFRPWSVSPDLTHPRLSFPHSSFQCSAESRRNSVSGTTGRGGAVTCARGRGWWQVSRQVSRAPITPGD